MPWLVRHEGSPKAVKVAGPVQIVQGLRDGLWQPTDEVKGPADASWVHIENHPEFIDIIEEMEPADINVHHDETHLDMNAMIDVCMVLLIFFIITTTHATAVQKIIPLPAVPIDEKKGTKVYSAEQVEKSMIRVQVVGQPGMAPTVKVQNQEVQVAGAKDGIDTAKLSAVIRQHVRAGPAKTEMILDAQGITWGTAIAIQDAAKNAGVLKIHRLKR